MRITNIIIFTQGKYNYVAIILLVSIHIIIFGRKTNKPANIIRTVKHVGRHICGCNSVQATRRLHIIRRGFNGTARFESSLKKRSELFTENECHFFPSAKDHI